MTHLIVKVLTPRRVLGLLAFILGPLSARLNHGPPFGVPPAARLLPFWPKWDISVHLLDQRFSNPSPDPLDDLGDDGISKGSKAVHPMGKPMKHSTHLGFR